MTTTIKNITQVFGLNAMIANTRGLSVQECADINKQAAIIMFNMSEVDAEKLVTKWVQECKKAKIMR